MGSPDSLTISSEAGPSSCLNNCCCRCMNTMKQIVADCLKDPKRGENNPCLLTHTQATGSSRDPD